MMLELLQALFLIALGVGAASTVNLVFDWRRNHYLDKWLSERRYLPTCARAGTVRPGRRS